MTAEINFIKNNYLYFNHAYFLQAWFFMPLYFKYCPEIPVNFIERSVQLLNNGLGENYITQAVINSYNKDQNVSFLLAFKEKEIVGISVFCTGQKTEISNHLLKDLFHICHIPPTHTVTLRLHTVVDEKHRDKGIAKQLIEQSKNSFKSQVYAMISTTWTNSKSIVKLLIKSDFKKAATIPRFWYEDSLQKKYTCPVCGFPPCNCKAQIFICYFSKKH